MGLTKPRAAQIYNLDYKQSTRVVTVTNITLSGGAPNLVDGVTLSLNDRILVTGQSTGSQNGLYLVTTVGSGSNGTWARTTDANETGEIEAGMIIMVTQGTIYADTQWKLITDDPITVGTTALTFVQNYSANSIAGGNSNVTVLNNANVLLSSAGTANVVDVFGTGVKITGTQSVTGNTTAGNVLTGGLISATGNVTGNYFLGNVACASGIFSTKIFSGTTEANIVSANGNLSISVGGTSNVAVFATTGEYVTGLVSATGNVQGGNVLTAGLISATGNVTGNYFLGNVACASGIFSTKIFSGTTEANIVSANGNLAISVGGTSNVAVYATTGEYVTGLVSATGNVQGGNLRTAGLISATGAVTAASVVGGVMTGSSVSVTGAVTGGSATVGTGNITAGNLILSGAIVDSAQLDIQTSASNANIVLTPNGTGNVNTPANVSATGNVQAGNIRTVGLVSATGNVTGNNFIGNGSALTGLNAFGTVTVSGQSNIAAVGLNAPLTFAAGSNIAITTGGNTVTIAYTAVTSTSIFATGGDMGLISQAVTASEDLGNVTTLADTSYDLGTLFVTDTFNQIDMTGFTSNINTGNLNAIGLANIVGNINGGNITTVGLISATGNIQAGNLRTAGLISATGNTTAGNILTGGLISATANISGGNILTAGLISATGTITTAGNLSLTGNIVDTGALWVNTTANGNITLNANGTGQTIVSTALSVAGNILPSANVTYDLGSTTARWRTIYTTDLELNNGIGDYTVVEGADDLFLYNNRSGKVFKFALIEVDPTTAPPKARKD